MHGRMYLYATTHFHPPVLISLLKVRTHTHKNGNSKKKIATASSILFNRKLINVHLVWHDQVNKIHYIAH